MHNLEKWMIKPYIVCLCAMVCCALWGSAFPCIKVGYRLFQIPSDDAAAQILFAGCRFVLAGVFAVLLGSLIEKRWLLPKRSSFGKIVKLSLLQTVAQYVFFYVGLAHTTGVKASIIGGMNVFVAILAASLLFRQEMLTARKLLGSLLGFAGVILVNLGGQRIELKFAWNGEGFILLSTIAYAFSSVFLKRYSKEEEPVLLSGCQFFAGGLLMIACGLFLGGRLKVVTGAGIAMLLYLGLLSAAAYSLWGILLKYNPVSKVTVFGLMNPVFGVIFSAMLLGEENSLDIMCFAALLLVCLGIFVVNAEGRHSAAKE